MPRPPTGKPHWEAVALKLPKELLSELRRYADTHRTTLSEVIRQGLLLRLHGGTGEEYNGYTMTEETVDEASTQPSAVSALVEQAIRTVYQEESERLRAVVREVLAETMDQWLQSHHLNGASLVTESATDTPASPGITVISGAADPETYSGNTVISGAAEAVPPFDTVKHRLGTLCSRTHDYHGTGQSLRLNNRAGSCLACEAERSARRRAVTRQVTTPA